MSNFSFVYFKKSYVFQTKQRKTIEWLVNTDLEGKLKESLAQKYRGTRGIRLEDMRNVILYSTQNIQHDVRNKSTGFNPLTTKNTRKSYSFSM